MAHFTYASQPELIRLTQKDDETIRTLCQQIFDLLSTLISARTLHNHINKLQLISSLIYYSLTQGRAYLTIGEEYTNVRPYNDNDFEYAFTDIKRSRRILYILLSTFPTILLKNLKHKLIMKQQSTEFVNAYIKNIPDLENIYNSIKEFHFAYFLIHGQFYEITKRICGMSNIFTRKPPTHNIQYKNIGRFYLIVLLYQFIQNAIQIYRNIKLDLNRVIIFKEPQQSSIKRTQCLLCYDDATNISCTPCGHLYCWECIQKQAHIKPICPICRTDCPPNKIVQLLNYN